MVINLHDSGLAAFEFQACESLSLFYTAPRKKDRYADRKIDRDRDRPYDSFDTLRLYTRTLDRIKLDLI